MKMGSTSYGGQKTSMRRSAFPWHGSMPGPPPHAGGSKRMEAMGESEARSVPSCKVSRNERLMFSGSVQEQANSAQITLSRPNTGLDEIS